MELFNEMKDIIDVWNQNQRQKYYVYRLLDPRNLQTFYVGKGCGDRVLQHARNAKSLINVDEDELSLKVQIISDIIACGKEVVPIIHRHGLTEKEAFEVEAALIDAYPGLTNIQKGHGSERGAILLKELCDTLKIAEYSEPTEKYIIIKTTPAAINANGGLYNAIRKAWRANLSKAKKYKYVLAVVYGIVREIYEVKEWYPYTKDRIAFEGMPTTGSLSSLKNKRIPVKYRAKGVANPFLYK